MATFYANTQVNLTGKGGGSGPGNVYYADAYTIGIQYANFYEVVTGNFTYQYGTVIPNGQIQTDTAYDNYGNIMTSWNADGGFYDAKTMFNYLDAGQTKQLFAYAFRLDDRISGSQYNDKLAGYDGDDWIDGWFGNDKLTGGKGDDTFYFAADNGRDVIKDFNLKYDEIQISSSLASSYADVRAVASSYKKGVILDFGANEQIKIEGLKIKQLKKVDFDFI